DEVRFLAFAAGVFVWPNVGIGPAVEAAGFDAGEVVRPQIITQCVALLHGGPKLSGNGIPFESDRIAGALGDELLAAAIRIVAGDRSTEANLARVHVGAGSCGQIELLALLVKQQVARPMPATD